MRPMEIGVIDFLSFTPLLGGLVGHILSCNGHIMHSVGDDLTRRMRLQF